jgi:hypothetical protein
MEESDRYEMSEVHKVFNQATGLWQKSALFLGLCTCPNVTTDGKVECFTMESTKIIVSTAYLLQTGKSGTYIVLPYIYWVHDRQWITDAAGDRPLLYEGDEVWEQIYISNSSASFNYLAGHGRGSHCQLGRVLHKDNSRDFSLHQRRASFQGQDRTRFVAYI